MPRLYFMLCLTFAVASFPLPVLAGDRAETVRAFVGTYCVDCHGGDSPAGGLNLNSMSGPEPAGDARQVAAVVHHVAIHDMPPPEAEQPSGNQRQSFLDSLTDLAAPSRARPASVRRMSRFEYAHTVQDLLGIQADLAELLPEDGKYEGFDNVAGGLGISSVLLERYLEAANVAFEATIRRIRPLAAASRSMTLMDDPNNVDSVEKNKGGVITLNGAFVDFTPGWPPARVDAVHPIEDGVYRCRMEVWPHEPNEHRTLAVAVFTGPLFGPGKRVLQGVYDVSGSSDEPRLIEFTTFMAEGEALHVLPWIYPEHVTWRDKDESRPGVAILSAETYGPLDQEFPSAAQKALFGDRDSLSMEEGAGVYMRHRRGVHRHSIVSSRPEEDIRRIVSEFVSRAVRRPAGSELQQQFVDLAVSRWKAGSPFEEAVRAGVTAVLCSPHFLLLNTDPEVDDYTIASRLSYFLWSSIPDDQLLRLAAAGRLSDPTVRVAQAERMLKDPRSDRFIQHFADQWLDLDQLEFTTPDSRLYPEYDELLLYSMREETLQYLRYMVDEDRPLKELIASDYTFLNQRLAAHYGIPGVRGHEHLRLVRLPADSLRGGVLSQAAVLKVTANGTTTSPVLRGSWLQRNILDHPAPPPPSGVPAVEPDIRGAVTIRQQLQQHTAHAACARCHLKIDPPGFAMEEFDVIGGWRSQYRSTEGKGRRVQKTNYYAGPEVHSEGRLPDGTEFNGFREYRAYLVSEEMEAVRNAVTRKLLIYATGRPTTRMDRADVRKVTSAVKARNGGIRSIILEVINSPLFLSP